MIHLARRSSVSFRRLALVLFVGTASAPVAAQVASAPSAAADAVLFAVEIRIGPKWDPAKPPQEQASFREHSANLRRMRESGVLIMGARYSDKGLVVVSAANIAAARAQMDQDPSIAAGTFSYEVYPFSVFYPGELKATPRR